MIRMKRISLALALLLAFSISLGCTTKPPAATPTPSGKPKPEGSVVFAIPNLGIEGFQPWVGDPADDFYWEFIFDWPFYVGAKSRQIIPGLATRYEYSQDYKSITLYLRKGVQWQGGWGEVTAEDIKYTFERTMAKTSTTSVGAELRAKVVGINVVDPYTVVFLLKEPDPSLHWVFTQVIGMDVPIVSKKYFETVGDVEANAHPIGSGSYRFVERKSGDYIKFEAVEDHWRNVPEFKYVTVRAVPEQSTRLAMLKTGAIDGTDITAEQIPEVEAAGLQARRLDSGYAVWLNFGGMFDPEDKGFKPGYHLKDSWVDVRVREAMNLAVDRNAIARAIYGGAAKPMPIVSMPGWDQLQPIPYDTARAKKLLAEAGFPQGFGFEVWSYEFEPATELPRVIEAVAGYWENIGLKPKIVKGTWNGFRPKIVNTAERTTAGAIYATRNFYMDDFTSRAQMWFMPNASNVSYQSPQLTAIIRKLSGLTAPDKRDSVFKEMAKYLRDDYSNVPIIWANSIWGLSKKIGEWPSGPASRPYYLEWIRHAQPLNTPRLFTPN